MSKRSDSQGTLFNLGPMHPKDAEEKLSSLPTPRTEADHKAQAAAHKEVAEAYRAHPAHDIPSPTSFSKSKPSDIHDRLAQKSERDANSARIASHPATLAAEKLGSHARYSMGFHKPEAVAAAHKEAGEAHLAAAKANPENAHEHMQEAAFHAKEAGGAWDEEKHPRDNHGQFA